MTSPEAERIAEQLRLLGPCNCKSADCPWWEAVCKGKELIASALTLCHNEAVEKTRKELDEDIQRVLIGGNHLAEELNVDHPSYSMSVEDGREWYFSHYSPAHWISMYNKWVCWRAIMLLRNCTLKVPQDG